MTSLGRVGVAVLAAALAAATLAACGPSGAKFTDYRAYSEHFAFRIGADPVPPMAEEKTQYRVVVTDRETGQPIEGGEGIIYAQTRDGARTWDTFTGGPEVGTYHATLNFVVDGNWAMGLRFRKDSTQKLEQVDWMQEVVPDTSKIP